MLKFKNLTTGEKNPYLNNLNLNIKKGTITLLKYKSTMEKNKIIDIICQLENPKSGQFIISEKDPSNLKKRKNIVHKQLGICYEDFKLIKTKSVLGNIVFPLEIHTKLSRAKILELGENTLKRFGLFEKKDDDLSTLSLEEKQRLNIARSVIHNPELIILDNPCKFIDVKKVGNLMDYIIDLNRSGKTILIISNNKEVEKRIQGSKYLLEKGAVTNV